MVYYPRKRKGVKKPYKKRIYKRKASAHLSKPMRNAVKKLIHGQAENKLYQSGNTGYNSFYIRTTGLTSSDPIAIAPTIIQGQGQSNRIGNSIMIRKAHLRGILSLTDSASAGTVNYAGPFYVRMMIGYVKQTPTTLPTTADFNQLFQTNNSSQNANSYLTTLQYPVNKDYWTIVHDKRHKIGTAFNVNNLNTTNGIGNNDFSIAKLLNIDLTKHFKKKVLYNDNSPTPMNTSLFMWCIPVNYVGYGSTTLPTAGPAFPNAVCQLDCEIDFSYEDC